MIRACPSGKRATEHKGNELKSQAKFPARRRPLFLFGLIFLKLVLYLTCFQM
jgi:hypothetical protein